MLLQKDAPYGLQHAALCKQRGNVALCISIITYFYLSFLYIYEVLICKGRSFKEIRFVRCKSQLEDTIFKLSIFTNSLYSGQVDPSRRLPRAGRQQVDH